MAGPEKHALGRADDPHVFLGARSYGHPVLGQHLGKIVSGRAGDPGGDDMRLQQGKVRALPLGRLVLGRGERFPWPLPGRKGLGHPIRHGMIACGP
jgi:hypothetical protein